MFHFLKGIITEKITQPSGHERLILDVGGIGYEIHTSLSALELFGRKGEASTVYTTLIHREDQMTLFGFPTLLEKELFNLLFSVSGVGPKTALNLLNNLTVSEISYSILNENTSALCKAQGIGTKTASRIVLELKEKITNWQHLPIAYSKGLEGQRTRGPEAHQSSEISDGQKEHEARLVLQSLGYAPHEINQAFSKAKLEDNHKDPESLIHFSLKWLSIVNK